VWTSDPITHIGEETGEITADISGAGLTVDGFYAVAVEMQRATGDCQLCWIVILEVAEVATLSLPTLPDCDDDDVLTAAQWNDLSEYAEALAAAALAPRPGFPSRSTHHTNALNSLFWGGLRKLSNTLRLQVWWRALDESAEVRIVINDTNVLDITHDTPASTTADNSELAATPFTGYTNYTPYYGSVDLSSLGLATGACYTLEVRCSDDEGIMDTWSHASVDYLYQELDTSPDTTGWVNLSEWAHGNYVGGSTGTPKVQDIKADLAWLGARITNANVAARQRYADETPGTPRGSQTREFELWMIRTHRWLWFLGELDDTPLLRYYADGWQEVSLPATETYGRHSYDLDQLPLLAQGQRYLVRGAFAAIEDINA
jgi:hypothetical protein